MSQSRVEEIRKAYKEVRELLHERNQESYKAVASYLEGECEVIKREYNLTNKITKHASQKEFTKLRAFYAEVDEAMITCLNTFNLHKDFMENFSFTIFNENERTQVKFAEEVEEYQFAKKCIIDHKINILRIKTATEFRNEVNTALNPLRAKAADPQYNPLAVPGNKDNKDSTLKLIEAMSEKMKAMEADIEKLKKAQQAAPVSSMLQQQQPTGPKLFGGLK